MWGAQEREEIELHWKWDDVGFFEAVDDCDSDAGSVLDVPADGDALRVVLQEGDSSKLQPAVQLPQFTAVVNAYTKENVAKQAEEERARTDGCLAAMRRGFALAHSRFHAQGRGKVQPCALSHQYPRTVFTDQGYRRAVLFHGLHMKRIGLQRLVCKLRRACARRRIDLSALMEPGQEKELEHVMRRLR